MATIGKARLKKLLAKGLTGWEAGALIFREGLERDWGGKECLTDSDVANIKNSLKTNKDIEAYNSFLETARTVDQATHQACFGGMVVISRLLNARLILKDCKWLVIYIGDEEASPGLLKEVNKKVKKGEINPLNITLNVQSYITKARDGLGRFLAFKSVIEDFYRLMGLKKFGGNLEACYEEIIYELESLNKTIKELQYIGSLRKKEPVPVIDASKLDTIDITKLKPEAETLKMVRGWIAKEGIGDNWWKETKLAPELEVAGEVEEEASLDG